MLKKVTNFLLFFSGLTFWWQARIIIDDYMVRQAPFEFARTSVYAVQLILLVTLALAFYQWFKSDKKIIDNIRWFWLLIVFSLYLALNTVFFSRDIYGFQVLGQWLLLLVLIFYFQTTTSDSKKYFIFGLVAGASVLSVWAWMQWLFQYQFASSWLGVAEHLPNQPGTAVVLNGNDRIMRVYAGLAHPNILGGYLTLVVLTFIYYKRELFSKIPRQWINVFIVIAVSALMLTFSRSAIFGLVVGLVILATQANFIKNNFKDLFIIFLTIIFLFFAYNNLYLSRLTSSNYLENKSTTERLSGYTGFKADIGNQWLFGLGFSGYQKNLITNSPALNGYEIQPIHNAWLFLLAQIGLVGLLLFAGVIYYSTINKYVLIAVLVIGLFDHYFVSLFFGQLLLAMVFIKFNK